MKYLFEMALVFLKQGKKIRRAEWMNGVHLCIIDGEVFAVDAVIGVQFQYSLIGDDLLAEDWEVIDEA